jgi:hypothetical protein
MTTWGFKVILVIAEHVLVAGKVLPPQGSSAS